MTAEKIVTGNWGRNAKKPVVPASTGADKTISASPQQSNPQFSKGADLAGSKVKLGNGVEYQLKGAQEGQPTPKPEGIKQPEPLSQVIPGSTPDPSKSKPLPAEGVQVKPSETPTDPTKSTIPGLDIGALKKAGLDQASIDKILSITNPLLAGEQNKLQNAQYGLDFIQKSLEEENKTIQDTYSAQKQAEKDLATQKQSIIDESAKVQAGTLEQQKAQEEHTIEQEKKRYELARAREERSIQDTNIKNEEQTSRSLASSLGMAFSSFGTARIMEVRQKGEEILSDARAETAYGNAEFSFRIQDIERNYGNELNRVEQSRRDLQIQNLTSLNDELQAIDEKALSSMSEKKEAAREAIKDYLKTKDGIDDNVAKINSGLVEKVYDEVDKVKKEKLEAETADLDLSSAYGYFVNKWGQPVNKKLDGSPTPYLGDYDKDLSAQFGYLVNQKGQAIRDEKGNTISYTPMDTQLYNDALKAYYSGTSTVYQQGLLNSKVGTNNFIRSAVKAGSYGGQCGTFVRSTFTTEGSWETECAGKTGADMNTCSLNSKRNMVNQRGFKRGAGTPSVGDVVIFDGSGYGAVGHYAMISEIDPVKGEAVLTESNLDLKGTVSTSRRVKLDDKQIYGFFTPNLKQGVIDQQPTFVAPGSSASEGFEGANANYNPMGYTIEDAKKANVDEKSKVGFAIGAIEAENVLKAYKDAGVSISDLNTTAANLQPDPVLGYIPMTDIVNNLKNARERDVMRARLRWIENVLRPKSGAAISVGEYQSYATQFFTTPGASEQEVNNAAKARQVELDKLAYQAGKGAPLIGQYFGNNKSSYEVAPADVAPAVQGANQVGQNANGMFSGLASMLSNVGRQLQGKSQETANSVDDMYNGMKDQYDALIDGGLTEEEAKEYLGL